MPNLADWIHEHHPLCRHITKRQIEGLIASKRRTNGLIIRPAMLLVFELGRPLTARWASNQITKWRREAQIPPWIDGREKNSVPYSRYGCDKIAECRSVFAPDRGSDGWSVLYAAQVIAHYAQVSPDESDAVLRKLNRAKSLSQDTKM